MTLSLSHPHPPLNYLFFKLANEGPSTHNFPVLRNPFHHVTCFPATETDFLLPFVQRTQTATHLPGVGDASSAPAQILLHFLPLLIFSHLPKAQHSKQDRASIKGLGSTPLNHGHTFPLHVLHMMYLLTHLSKIIMNHMQFLLPWSIPAVWTLSQLFPILYLCFWILLSKYDALHFPDFNLAMLLSLKYQTHFDGWFWPLIYLPGWCHTYIL